jgi:hypothetical protein
MRYRHVEDHDNWQAARCEAGVPGTPRDARAGSHGTCPLSDELGGPCSSWLTSARAASM